MDKAAVYTSREFAEEAARSFKGPQIVDRVVDMLPNGDWIIGLIFSTGMFTIVTHAHIDRVVS